MQLLLLLCGGSQAKDIAKSIAPEVWDTILRLAEAHGVVPQLFAQSARFNMPPGPLRKLQSLDRWNTQRSLRLTRDLLRVLEHFKRREIPALPYKGPTLSQYLFGDVAMRQSGDLDLLVRPSDVRHACAALRELGYRPHFTVAEARESDYLASGYEYMFDNDAGQNVLELKWRILPRFYRVDFDVNTFFARAGCLRIGDSRLPTFCAEDLLLVLCVHAAKHLWSKLCWLYDITRLVNTKIIDWHSVRRRAGVLGVERILALNFLLIRHFFGSIPREAYEGCRLDSAAHGLLQELMPRLLLAGESDTESFSYFHFISRMRERPRDRARFWWRLASTPGLREWSSVELPQSWASLYKAVRAYRLARRLLLS